MDFEGKAAFTILFKILDLIFFVKKLQLWLWKQLKMCPKVGNTVLWASITFFKV